MYFNAKGAHTEPYVALTIGSDSLCAIISPADHLGEETSCRLQSCWRQRHGGAVLLLAYHINDEKLMQRVHNFECRTLRSIASIFSTGHRYLFMIPSLICYGSVYSDSMRLERYHYFKQGWQ